MDTCLPLDVDHTDTDTDTMAVPLALRIISLKAAFNFACTSWSAIPELWIASVVAFQ